MSKESAARAELIGWAYVRVSTLEQSNVLHGSSEQQQNRIKRWQTEQSQRTGIKHRITRFIDEDISGRVQSLHKRDEYHELARAVKQKAIDFVVIEKIDRLHRNQIEIRKFIDLCDEMGIKLYRLDGGLVDLKDRSSRTSVFIESWMAEEYSLDLVEKLTKKGREARVNNGKDNQSMPVLGLDEHPTEACFYLINPAEKKIVEDIFNHFCSSEDLQKTAQYCHKKAYCTKIRYTRPKVDKGQKIPPKLVGGEPFDSRTLRALLVSRKIAGFGYFKDDWGQFPSLQDDNGMVMWKFRHGPVVDPELFERAQEILRKNCKHNHRIYENQRTYFLSGILFDADGNRFSGQSVKNKKNPYYINPSKNYRVPAERLEKVVVNYVSSLLKENGILEQAIKNTFYGENPGLKKLESHIAHNAKETKQCAQLLEMLASQGRKRMIDNPDRMEEILLEGIEVRKETQSRLDELREESNLLQSQYEQFLRYKHKENVRSSLKEALDLFESSYSPRKKQIIQSIVPKLILDETTNRFHLFINPFLEKLGPIAAEEIVNFPSLMPKKQKSPDSGLPEELAELPMQILSQSEKKVCIATDWRGGRDSNPRPPA